MPKPFYEIDPKTYLFERNEHPEEKVRQWVLFELLSTYGFNINDIKIEVPCKEGSKYVPADVVVYQEHSPFVIIECKRQEDDNTEEAIKQAISYANYLEAHFAVATNGHNWIVKRKQYGEWASVIDISKPLRDSPNHGLDYLLWVLDDLKPVLFWIYKTVPENEAEKFLSLLGHFFAFREDDYKVDKDLYELNLALIKLAS